MLDGANLDSGAGRPSQRCKGSRRGDGAIAIEQSGAGYANRNYGSALAVLDTEQRHQRQNAAFTVVVEEQLRKVVGMAIRNTVTGLQ